jgi:hypothetical protein
VYKAHSFRAAATSAALLKGASLSDILQLADWSTARTFKRFYNKPIDTSSQPVGAKYCPVVKWYSKDYDQYILRE